ncbi:DUF642 domain-containing protein [Photobacterium sanctipauli]|uniref:DUF642 domain-containing protein n=1 Tax=Photobacterium sanctipauli TaxID=1342794 RepID=A0A2T3NNM9_9GAMM|nr:DUF642 domain-containing protein [Photobacterium sanctipauli]PSW17592.1 DUF642 domain-containing protein [Photobacterium sanctipauli]
MRWVTNSALKLVLAFSLVFSFSSQANLIINGSFEDIDVRDGRWSYFVPGTPRATGLGWQGDNVEIWDSLFGFEASDGEQHAELNAHPNQGDKFSIFQTFNTIENALYQLSFDYAARRNRNESFNVSVTGDNTLLDYQLDDHTRFSWRTYSGMFTADSSLTTLRFTSNNDGTLGNLIDNVSVTPVNNALNVIPEPDLLFPLILLILFLAVRYQIRRHQ